MLDIISFVKYNFFLQFSTLALDLGPINMAYTVLFLPLHTNNEYPTPSIRWLLGEWQGLYSRGLLSNHVIQKKIRVTEGIFNYKYALVLRSL